MVKTTNKKKLKKNVRKKLVIYPKIEINANSSVVFSLENNVPEFPLYTMSSLTKLEILIQIKKKSNFPKLRCPKNSKPDNFTRKVPEQK